MRKISSILATGAGVAVLSLAAAGVAAASESSTQSIPGIVKSTTTTHTMPYLAAQKVSTIYPGSEVEVRCWIKGQLVDGNEIWFNLGGGLDFAPRAAIQHSATVPACRA